ncbi:glycoside hydrolase family 16 protein (macronuclear) [Tetrahymena thermophila SB210]|uniref:Glycoside hydrolase family 16 protein n=1 Tax=Tetrahymena thermophila (strain SB210) TaxID=312017 RepID=I7MAX2_TETTS|nr:glycoside hydrolase family 16 protein [Tetrahymena thermophila SB210]EAS06315.2 glycoside hydrolase family 16 protein [Tetrahymena thermophila SB210]|eukprot:XP_001026560.2 glycoside hydrolase family 16 protein [Tetrahymena thermophila SB210]
MRNFVNKMRNCYYLVMVFNIVSVINALQQSAYIETDFIEDLTKPALNSTRWMDYSTAQPFQFDQDSKRWTTHNPAYLQLGVSLPNNPDNAKGMSLRLSQSFCTEPGNKCCFGSKCSNWAGVHLESNSCFQYGVFKIRASFKLSNQNDALFFFGIYVESGSNMDSSSVWNEIDIGYGNGPSFNSQTQFLPATFSPNENKKVFDSNSNPSYTDNFSNGYHNYALYWMPSYVAWTIDDVVYWNSTNSSQYPTPWRCSSFRIIFRTDNGQSTASGDHFAYIQSIQYISKATYLNTNSQNSQKSGDNSIKLQDLSIKLLIFCLFYILI